MERVVDFRTKISGIRPRDLRKGSHNIPVFILKFQIIVELKAFNIKFEQI